MHIASRCAALRCISCSAALTPLLLRFVPLLSGELLLPPPPSPTPDDEAARDLLPAPLLLLPLQLPPMTAAPPPSRGRRPFTRAAVSRPAYDRTASELPSREAAIMQGIKLLDQRILVRSTQTNPLKEQITAETPGSRRGRGRRAR